MAAAVAAVRMHYLGCPSRNALDEHVDSYRQWINQALELGQTGVKAAKAAHKFWGGVVDLYENDNCQHADKAV